MRPFLTLTAFAAALGLVTASPVRAEEEPAQAAPEAKGPPALIVAISIDQFSADLFAQYRPYFKAGLGGLMRGAVFPSGYQSHAATETCPGHSTILTGVHPARSGIVANWWFDPKIARADKRVYCAEDETDPASTSRNPVVSASHLRVPTLGERLKAVNPRSLNVAVSGKDRAAMMMGGKQVDAAYWWDGSGFTSFSGRKLGTAATEINRKVTAMLETGHPEFPVPPFCEPRDRAVAVGKRSIGTGKFALTAGDAQAFKISPHLDGATAGLALELVDELQLGRDDVPDVLSISLSATDYIGHTFGHQGLEMCIQLAQLDKTLGRLFSALDKRGIDFAVVLTADHGGIDAPERLRQQAYPQARRLAPELETDALGKRIAKETGITVTKGPLLLGGVAGDIYLSAELSQDQRRTVALALIADLKAHPQVEAVFHADEIAAAPMPTGSPQDWSALDRVRASFDETRSGDLVVVLKRGVVPTRADSGAVTTHGSIWDYDRRVPILFWRKGLPGFEQPAPVETVDIAPTLAALLHLEVPAGDFDGRCLDIDGGPDDICAE